MPDFPITVSLQLRHLTELDFDSFDFGGL